MTASVGGLNAQVMKLIALNDIASDDAHSKMRRGANKQEVAQKEVQNAVEQYGRDLQAVQNWINTGKAAVQAGTAVAGVASGVEGSQTQGDLNSGMNADAAQQTGGTQPTNGVQPNGTENTGSTDPHAALKDVTLFEGENGQPVKVGDRFTDAQLELLTSGEPFTKQQALDAGFSDREASELMMRQGDDGLSQGQAASFMQQNARGENGGLMANQTELLQRGTFTQQELEAAGFTEAEQADLLARTEDGPLTQSEMQDFMANRNAKGKAKKEFEKAIKEQIFKFIELGFQESQRDVQEGAKQAGETKEKLSELVEQGADIRSEHKSELEQLELEGLQQQRLGLDNRREIRG